MRKPYLTKKRKKEISIAYQEIDYLKKSIIDIGFEIEVFCRNNMNDEAKSRNAIIEKYQTRLAELEKEGWMVN